MRLVKFVRIGLGLAATGGAVVVLSGNAWAADGSQGAATQPAQAKQETKSTVTQSADQNNVSQNAVTQVAGDKSGGTGTGTGTSDNSGSGSQATPGAGTALPATDKKDATPTAKTDEPAVVKTDAKAESVQPVVPIVVTPKDDSGAAAIEATPVMIYRTAVLPIQPTIINRPVYYGDLAAKMPSAPVAKKSPVPPQSSGALGKLTMVLAGTVVPLPFLLQPAVFERDALASLLLGLVLLFLTMAVVSNYGQWLRRGGFATAARSDVPARHQFNFFATPLLLGYELTPPRRHSPFLDLGVGNLFLTLSERR